MYQAGCQGQGRSGGKGEYWVQGPTVSMLIHSPELFRQHEQKQVRCLARRRPSLPPGFTWWKDLVPFTVFTARCGRYLSIAVVGMKKKKDLTKWFGGQD